MTTGRKAGIDAVLGICVSVLVAVNGFFIKRLVDQIDLTRQEVIQCREQIAIISYRLDAALKPASFTDKRPFKGRKNVYRKS